MSQNPQTPNIDPKGRNSNFPDKTKISTGFQTNDLVIASFINGLFGTLQKSIIFLKKWGIFSFQSFLTGFQKGAIVKRDEQIFFCLEDNTFQKPKFDDIGNNFINIQDLCKGEIVFDNYDQSSNTVIFKSRLGQILDNRSRILSFVIPFNKMSEATSIGDATVNIKIDDLDPFSWSKWARAVENSFKAILYHPNESADRLILLEKEYLIFKDNDQKPFGYTEVPLNDKILSYSTSLQNSPQGSMFIPKNTGGGTTIRGETAEHRLTVEQMPQHKHVIFWGDYNLGRVSGIFSGRHSKSELEGDLPFGETDYTGEGEGHKHDFKMTFSQDTEGQSLRPRSVKFKAWRLF